MRQNLQCVGQGKLRRGCGFAKLLDGPNYNNSDFHDQLLTYTGAFRQPPTMVLHAESTQRAHHLFLGTQSTLARLKEVDGDYEILGTGFGGVRSTSAAAPRFTGAQVGDYLAFTNDFDKPMFYQLESSPTVTYTGVGVPPSSLGNPGDTYTDTGSPSTGSYIKTTASGWVSWDPTSKLFTFDDLDVIGLSRAKVCWSYQNCLFFADVEMDGERFGYRIVWSDYQNPTSFDPAKLNSLAGTWDLYTYERILGGQALGSTFLIYTTHGIWEMVVVGGEQSFQFIRLYNGEANVSQALLKYPNTLVSLEDAHIYCAEDGVYVFSQYYGKPQRLDWIHQSSPWIYNNIDDVNCSVAVAGFSVTKVGNKKEAANEVYISTASVGAANNCPDRTLRINMTYKVCDVVDAGFTAFCNHQAQMIPTARDLILELGICDAAEMQSNGYGYGKEGLPKPIPTSTANPTCFYTTVPANVATFETAGLPQVPTQIWRTAGIATVRLPAHGLSTGSLVRITGYAQNSFNTDQAAITVTDANHFTYVNPGPDVAAPSGSAQIKKILPSENVSVLVLANGVATVSLPAHGLANGSYVQITGAGTSVINASDAQITVLDVNTFTYTTSATTAATIQGAAGVSNIIPAGSTYSFLRWPASGDIPGMVVGVTYSYVPGPNENYLQYGVSHIFAATSFSYQITNTPNIILVSGPSGLNPGFPVTAFLTDGIQASLQPLGTAITPSSATRSPSNPSIVQITATGHGLSTGDTIKAESMTDSTMNTSGAVVTVVDANDFTYSAPAPVQNPQVFPLTLTNVVSEDLTQPSADPNSLCVAVGTGTIDDTCAKCQGTTLFVAISSVDWCAKQVGGVFYRETCQNTGAVGIISPLGYSSSVGSYLLNPYVSLWRFAPMFIERDEAPELQLDRVRIDFLAVPPTPPTLPNTIGLRVGIAAQPADPNTDDSVPQLPGESRFVWFQHSQQPLASPSQKTSLQHIAAGTIPSQYTKWEILRKGRVLAVELSLGGVGGDAEFTKIITASKEAETNKF